ncbi:MAG TPA: hypothetical protein VFS89_03805 [Nitrosospira sp.]|nr:hypothetical protein [Nitrosospira sp.]
MSGFRINGFSGLVPRLARQLLAPNQAQVAMNCVLTSGDLRPRNGPLLVFNPVIEEDIVSMFRMEKDGNEKWLAWSRDVDVARSPVADNEDRRFYYTGDGEPRVSNFDLATAGVGPYPSGCYVLGVSPPVNAMTVTPSGGTGADVTRFYTYTFVTPWDEESAPAPVSAIATGKETGATWALAGMDSAPPNSGTVIAAVKDTPSTGYVEITLNSVFGLRAYEEITFAAVAGMADINATFEIDSVDAVNNKVVIVLSTAQTYTSGGTWDRVAPHNTNGMMKRIYRTITTATGDEYHYVVTVAASTATYDDTATDEDVSLGDILPSTKWFMPPANMRGIVILPNGIAAGFTGNEIHFSEPYKPYAWPLAYRQAYDQDIVAIGITGTTLVGMTEGNPFTITGVDPLTMGGGMEKLAVAWPCMSKRSVASFAFGVCYAAPQGLVIIGSQNDIVTKDLFTQKEWSDLNPDTFISATADNRYYSGYTDDLSSLMYVIDKTEAASFLKVNQKISAIWTDPATGNLYVADEKKIYLWEGDEGTKLPYEWRSKFYIFPAPINYGAAKIDADFTMTTDESSAAQTTYNEAVAANQALIDGNTMNDALGDPSLGEYEVGGDAMQPIHPLVIESLQFQLWAGGALKYTKQVTNTRAFRLPSGYKSDNCEVVLAGNVKVTAAVIAETMDGLKET